jgi:hypothetical protein
LTPLRTQRRVSVSEFIRLKHSGFSEREAGKRTFTSAERLSHSMLETSLSFLNGRYAIGVRPSRHGYLDVTVSSTSGRAMQAGFVSTRQREESRCLIMPMTSAESSDCGAFHRSCARSIVVILCFTLRRSRSTEEPFSSRRRDATERPPWRWPFIVPAFAC